MRVHAAHSEFLIARYAKEAFGVDREPTMVEASQKYAGPFAKGVLTLRESHVPFPDGYFDFVLCSSVLCVTAPERFEASVLEMARLARAGGTLLLMEQVRPGSAFSLETYRRTLARAGFDVRPFSCSWQKRNLRYCARASEFTVTALTSSAYLSLVVPLLKSKTVLHLGRRYRNMAVFRLCLILVFVAVLGTVSSAQSTTKPTMVMPDSTHWTMGKGVLSGYQVALLSGDPNKSGMYVVRIKLPANDKEPPHYHSSLENVTVISGTIYMGLGSKFDVRKMTAFPAGSFGSIPPHVVHYGMTKAPAVIQLEGIGPFSMTPVKAGM